MKNALNTLKVLVLFGALAIVGWSAIPSAAVAETELGPVCENTGHECHAIINGVTYHMDEVNAN